MEWLANIVPVLKVVTNAIRCCVHYRNINHATPKDEYLICLWLTYPSLKHKFLSFMDGNARYNQIKMVKKYMHKTTFRCPEHIGAYEYVVNHIIDALLQFPARLWLPSMVTYGGHH